MRVQGATRGRRPDGLEDARKELVNRPGRRASGAGEELEKVGCRPAQ
ncbi:MAG: hypothetical protein JO329_21255 [Planctomycetaceae bacterium]|nr:hypothetical protein [Planctomycetaceae bacterium]